MGAESQFVDGSNLDLSSLDKMGVTLSEPTMIPTFQIRRMIGQPRLEFNEEESSSLTNSILAIGQLQDGLVRPLIEEEISLLSEEERGLKYELIDGERRYRSCVYIDRDFKTKIAYGVTPEIQYLLSVALNFNRVNHNPGETVIVIKNLMSKGYSPSQVAKIIGASEVTVYKYRQLLGLDSRILEHLGPPKEKDKRLGVQVAFELTRVHPKMQYEVFSRLGEGPTIQRAKAVISSILEKNHDAINPDTKTRKMDTRNARRIIERLSSRAKNATESIPTYVLQQMGDGDSEVLASSLREAINSLTMFLQVLED